MGYAVQRHEQRQLRLSSISIRIFRTDTSIYLEAASFPRRRRIVSIGRTRYPFPGQYFSAHSMRSGGIRKTQKTQTTSYVRIPLLAGWHGAWTLFISARGPLSVEVFVIGRSGGRARVRSWKERGWTGRSLLERSPYRMQQQAFPWTDESEWELRGLMSFSCNAIPIAFPAPRGRSRVWRTRNRGSLGDRPFGAFGWLPAGQRCCRWGECRGILSIETHFTGAIIT